MVSTVTGHGIGIGRGARNPRSGAAWRSGGEHMPALTKNT
ncbi:hypothetical protein RAJCM14343_2701 [Rhodococcus aetherivorans]|uniref:Uncharacterized protein n=1 Tax=Rhodococcus aetherivorans TaxID=191292 RepID=A0ABQ0YLM2_9NOCA|nr:hypothetical protein RAJCM14343_2701 [Rhodococcus aetherivorans]